MTELPSVLERPNVLVVGGAGFLGSHLCRYLLDTCNVICVDDYSTGHESNIDMLLSNHHFEFIRHDISQPLDIRKYPGVDKFKVGFVGVQQIYHLGSQGALHHYFSHPIETLVTSAQGTKNVMDIAAAYRAKVVLGSDILVYGDVPVDKYPAKEEFRGVLDYLDPINYYAEGKRFAESLVEAYRRAYTLETKIVRLFGVYGPNMHFDDGRLVPEFIRKALAGEEIALPKDFTAAPFCYVDDAVQGLVKLMELEGHGEYNLGHGTPYTIREVAEKIVALTGSKSAITENPPSAEMAPLYQAWRQQALMANMYKTKEEAGWFPLVLLDEGLRITVDYLKARRNVRGISA